MLLFFTLFWYFVYCILRTCVFFVHFSDFFLILRRYVWILLFIFYVLFFGKIFKFTRLFLWILAIRQFRTPYVITVCVPQFLFSWIQFRIFGNITTYCKISLKKTTFSIGLFDQSCNKKEKKRKKRSAMVLVVTHKTVNMKGKLWYIRFYLYNHM